ncbi:MAG: hypothetical protein J1E39_02075 [Eubacterium sp.]|nr:hypothetical protein [Eubacterium sp.]
MKKKKIVKELKNHADLLKRIVDGYRKQYGPTKDYYKGYNEGLADGFDHAAKWLQEIIDKA